MLTLGILYKDGKIVNHRSLVKVLLNPTLRYFGFQIATECVNQKLGSVVLQKCDKTPTIKYDFNSYNPYDVIIKKRTIL